MASSIFSRLWSLLVCLFLLQGCSCSKEPESFPLGSFKFDKSCAKDARYLRAGFADLRNLVDAALKNLETDFENLETDFENLETHFKYLGKDILDGNFIHWFSSELDRPFVKQAFQRVDEFIRADLNSPNSPPPVRIVCDRSVPCSRKLDQDGHKQITFCTGIMRRDLPTSTSCVVGVGEIGDELSLGLFMLRNILSGRYDPDFRKISFVANGLLESRLLVTQPLSQAQRKEDEVNRELARSPRPGLQQKWRDGNPLSNADNYAAYALSSRQIRDLFEDKCKNKEGRPFVISRGDELKRRRRVLSLHHQTLPPGLDTEADPWLPVEEGP